jgi:hypothetical protein
MEKMEIMDSMDVPELTPSRGWTEITPKNVIFSHLIGFEVRQPAQSAAEGLYPLSYVCVWQDCIFLEGKSLENHSMSCFWGRYEQFSGAILVQ